MIEDDPTRVMGLGKVSPQASPASIPPKWMKRLHGASGPTPSHRQLTEQPPSHARDSRLRLYRCSDRLFHSIGRRLTDGMLLAHKMLVQC